MSGIESLVTQVHRGDTVPRTTNGDVPQQQPQTVAQPQSPREETCWSRIFCCGSKPRNQPQQNSDSASNPSTATQATHQSSNHQVVPKTPTLHVNTQNQQDPRLLQQSPRAEGRQIQQPSQQPEHQQQQHQPSLNAPLTQHTNGYTLQVHQDYNPVTNEYNIGDGFRQYLLPPFPPMAKHKKTLVLDLDETLVHSSFKRIDDADFQIQIELDGIIHNVYVRKRPFVDEFLLHVAQNWEVVIFTASLAKYADPLLDTLDTHRVISKRLFRESCVHHYKTYYVKDLLLLGRPISDCTIIDNSHFSYMFQPEQGVPIISWYDDRSDTQLRDILPFLDALADCKDIVSAMQYSQPLFVDGGIVAPYTMHPAIQMLPQEDLWNEKDEAIFQNHLHKEYASDGHLMMTIDGDHDGNGQNAPATPHVNRTGRSALNSPVAGKREIQ